MFFIFFDHGKKQSGFKMKNLPSKIRASCQDYFPQSHPAHFE